MDFGYKVDMIQTAPWHEAGHAVVAHALGLPVLRVGWEDNGLASTHVHVVADGADGRGKTVVVLFGGYVAELLHVQGRQEEMAAAAAAHDFELLKTWGIGDRLAKASRRTARDIVVANDEAMRVLALQLMLVYSNGALFGPALVKLLAKVRPYDWPPARWPELKVET